MHVIREYDYLLHEVGTSAHNVGNTYSYLTTSYFHFHEVSTDLSFSTVSSTVVRFTTSKNIYLNKNFSSKKKNRFHALKRYRLDTGGTRQLDQLYTYSYLSLS